LIVEVSCTVIYLGDIVCFCCTN